jgi:lysophospholipase L1-like esterase
MSRIVTRGCITALSKSTARRLQAVFLFSFNLFDQTLHNLRFPMKPTRIQLLLTALCAALFIAPVRAADPAPGLFRDHDRWAVVGDSITQGRTYYAWIYLYYATRFPSLTLDAYNCGISGDSAAGALRRYDWDIKPHHANVATIMLGMNDVSRGLYGEANPSEATLKRQAAALAAYRANMTELAGKLKTDGARLIFITPTPFDETADLAPARQTGVNGALGECAVFLRELAATTGASIVDLHGSMTALNLRLQKDDPKATIIGPDRIHPEVPGQFLMAYYFLKAQGAPQLVSNVDIDAAAVRVRKSENAEVTNLAANDGVISFTSFEKSLPYPIGDDYRPVLDWVPFEQDFNQEILRVTGLKPGFRTLVIDGQPVGEFDAAEFTKGINLATLNGTPQARQSATVLSLVREWQKTIAYWSRGIAQVEHWQLKDVPHPVSLETVRPQLEARLEELKGAETHMDKYNRSIIGTYLKVKPREAQTQLDIPAKAEAIRKAAQPVPHRYEIR